MHEWWWQFNHFSLSAIVFVLAGRVTTNEELEDMLESGNPSIFTSDVSPQVLPAVAAAAI